jgi:hypothetical protein
METGETQLSGKLAGLTSRAAKSPAIRRQTCPNVQALQMQLLLQRSQPVLHNYYKTLAPGLLF